MVSSPHSASRSRRPQSGRSSSKKAFIQQPRRASTTWADFLRSQAHALLACDFIETVTLNGQRQYILAVIEHASRRVRVLGTTTAHPTADFLIQTIRNLVMDPEDAGCRARFLIRDRDGKFPTLMDGILADVGIQTVLTGIRMPRMNSIMERWVQSCRRELLDRCLLWNEHHLRHALREYEVFYNRHRAHQALGQAAPQCTVPDLITDPERIVEPEHTPTRPARRHPPRILTCRLTCTDGIIGRRSGRPHTPTPSSPRRPPTGCPRCIG
ncbi:integrase core domain-containing protein [Nonomuraea sp. NPDC048881]|uniref:integrase core domain-containing protein n=1 Tax=Nonomuraea sp. NPDC048881 TaxID=3155030 RepID=UPI0033F097D7